jgi:hypothetical protein
MRQRNGVWTASGRGGLKPTRLKPAKKPQGFGGYLTTVMLIGAVQSLNTPILLRQPTPFHLGTWKDQPTA